MPLLDKPLSDLHLYRGKNPRPADFDSYWDQALAELAATDPQPKLERNPTCASSQAECFDLWFTGVGGARIYAKFLRPRARSPHPALLMFHGYGQNSGDWHDKLSWVGEGFAVAALDCRGQGGRSEDIVPARGTTLRGHFVRGLDDPDPQRLSFRHIFLDTVQLARVVMEIDGVDANRLATYGNSQGGGLALACSALEPRIRRTVSFFPFLCDYQRIWEMDLARDAYEELRYYFRQFDPLHEREREIFTRLGYIDCQHLAPRIQANVLMFTGLADAMCPPSSQFAAYNRIVARKDVVVYPDFGHEPLPGASDRALRFLRDL